MEIIEMHNLEASQLFKRTLHVTADLESSPVTRSF